MPEGDRYNILVVDDHLVFRRAVGMLLSDEPDFHVAAEAESGKQALDLCQKQNFDVILLDIRLPDISGVEVAHRLIHHGCSARIVMLSMRDEQEVRDALPPGVPFLSKSEPPQAIADTIRQAIGK